MKEFIEKLIEKLEENKYSHLLEHNSEECLHCQENADDWNCFDRNCMICVCDSTIKIVNEFAEEMNLSENLTSSDGWIPVSERLPEEAGVYEVTEEVFINSTKQYIVEHRLFGTEGEWLCPSNRKVIAWKPLPEPYKKGSETDE